MKPKQGILLIGLIEIIIGSVTLALLLQSLANGMLSKPPNVFAFVVISSLISVSLGIGVVMRWHYARKLLMFFAGWVILSKILVFSGIITLCCSLDTIAPDIQNGISILYHLFVIFYFHQPVLKKEFRG
ncbi:MAG: hypothetical protein WC732_08260 [Candidatus Omnitrophota bacterium]